ncbi:CCR4-NOT transcription complex subunit 7 [Euphorbia peplus]|nr:CCR4-NOT transcription complex subunit 7 [Euphorbia peplus]
MCATDRRHPPPSSSPISSMKPVEIRSVWKHNLESEFHIIRSVIDTYPVISMDTEFPGVVIRPADDDTYNWYRDPISVYSTLKANVDMLNLIQVGLTIADESGNLPDLGSDRRYIWEFNFRDFDASRDAHAHDSVQMLRTHGIDFERNLECGIDSVRFAELMMSSGLVLNDTVSWIAFHGAYDFGYLIKCLTQRVLPVGLPEFIEFVRLFFGDRVYDVKQLNSFCGLYGGLDRVAKSLGVERLVGKKHQAGSDSLLTLHAFQGIKEKFRHKSDGTLDKCANVLFGLELFT